MMSSLNPAWIIQKKRDGQELTDAEIHAFVQGLLDDSVADYQASALLMAIYFQGMTLNETFSLTQAMLESGERYDLSQIPGPKVDKHSTGGVGDKVSLILAPLAAACGLKVPMMSGRGLGHSGGTLDKLESISGFDVHLSPDKFKQVLNKAGCAMIGQSEKIAPADNKIYALRDVTGTVECIPLIAASILSKKCAEGTQALVLDVKIGSGAFMKSVDQARKLAKTVIHVSKKMELPCRALLTQMNQPLGYGVGNSIEMLEAIELLRNERSGFFVTRNENLELSSGDLKELVIQLCAHMLELGQVVKNLTDGRKLAYSKLADGSAWKVFQSLVSSQGGSLEQILDLKKLPHSSRVLSWRARSLGTINKMNTETMGRILVEMGGGRKKATDSINRGVGLIFHKKLGARVQTGEPIVSVYAPEHWKNSELADLEELFHQSLEISKVRKPVPKLIHEVLS